jgi:hypothetical protein
MKLQFSFTKEITMKMEINECSSIEVKEPISIPEIKEEIFNYFWYVMEKRSPTGKHGSPTQVVLKYRDKEITDKEEMISLISQKIIFRVEFEKIQF